MSSEGPMQLAGDDVFEVDANEVERLRAQNPKGQLIEWCQRQKPPSALPRFEVRRVRGAIAVRARLKALGVESPWFLAPRRKEAEQAAAGGLLELLPEADSAKVLQAHPRTLLSDAVSSGLLAEASVAIVGDSATTNAPPFVAEGRAVRLDGSEVRSGSHEASSKRGAIQLAARALVDQLGL